MLFYPGRIYLSEGLYRCIFIFHETYGRSILAQFQVVAKRHTLMASLQLELENAKRRERTDARPKRPA